MDNVLINYFQQFTTLTREESTALSDSIDIKEIEKGGFLLKEGQRNMDTFLFWQVWLDSIRLLKQGIYWWRKKIIPLLRGADDSLAVDPASNRYYDYLKVYESGIDNIINYGGRLTEYYDPGEHGSLGHMRQSAAFPNLM